MSGTVTLTGNGIYAPDDSEVENNTRIKRTHT